MRIVYVFFFEKYILLILYVIEYVLQYDGGAGCGTI